MMIEPIHITFAQGSLIIEGPSDSITQLKEFTLYDERTRQHKALARMYRSIILHCREQKIPVVDSAKNYESFALTLQKNIIPREHQKKALQAWTEANFQGVISLPTGAGKTILAVLAIQKVGRSTLIMVPTIDLLNQWHEVLSTFFNAPIGRLGGGFKDIHPITVSTYDSARLSIEQNGNSFGFLVFDECHHLPAPQNQLIAEASIAPFRLGLSATVHRNDGGEKILYELVGSLVFESHIQEMVSDVLSPYDVVQIAVQLTDEERQDYTLTRQIYINFLRKNRISMSNAFGWQQFIIQASRSSEGKEALRAYRHQKRIVQAATNKLHALWNIINAHSLEAMIIFTDDNHLAYMIGREFSLAVLTHKTKAAERKKFLDAFRDGTLNIIVTSKVLNEGVDVPEAAVGVVVSGSGTVREHVQRLGRILRHRPGKRAVLYELVTSDSSEQYVNQRRRQHSAYQKSP